MHSKRFHRNSSSTADTIAFSGHLVLDMMGNMVLTRQDPALRPGQRALAIVINVPKSIFKLPALRAEIAIPKGQVADTIVTKTTASVKDALAGLGLNITVVPPSDNDKR